MASKGGDQLDADADGDGDGDDDDDDDVVDDDDDGRKWARNYAAQNCVQSFGGLVSKSD